MQTIYADITARTITIFVIHCQKTFTLNTHKMKTNVINRNKFVNPKMGTLMCRRFKKLSGCIET